ncbi:MAG: aminotransferase class V-fold PLP-dependent enzyme [Gemmatimonadaceae bacterium]
MTTDLSVDVRAEFPRSARNEGIIYCNAASTGPLPARTIAVLDEWNRLRAEPWRITFEQQFETTATARELCARLIGADAEEIALMPNTSAGINLAAQILPVARDKVVLGHDGEFPANVYPWMALEQSGGGGGGARFEQIGLLPNGLPDWEGLSARVDRGDVGLVAISWVSFVSGDRADLMRIGAMCRERGIWFVVDGIQGVGTTSLDVHACNIDVLACGAQKWLLSPWGAGFCYVRRELTAQMDPRSVGWLGMRHSQEMSRMLEYDLTYLEDARKFEFAATAYQDVAGMNASLGMLMEIGAEQVEEHISTLAGRLIDGIALLPSLTLVTPREPGRRAGIVSFLVAESQTVSERLDSAGVVHSVRGGGVIRLAPHVYNTVDEIDRVLSVLETL